MYLPWVTEVHCSNCARCLRPFTGLEKLSALILNVAFLHCKGLNFPPARGRGWKFSFLTEAYPSPLHPASCTAQAASLTTLWASGGHFCQPTLHGEAVLCALAFDRSHTSNSYSSKAMSVSLSWKPPSLAARTCTILIHQDHLSSIWHSHAAGSEFTPCFWRLRVSLPFKLSGVFKYFSYFIQGFMCLWWNGESVLAPCSRNWTSLPKCPSIRSPRTFRKPVFTWFSLRINLELKTGLEGCENQFLRCSERRPLSKSLLILCCFFPPPSFQSFC